MTGHRSLEALRKYEHTSVRQHQAVSKVMMSTRKVKCDEKLKENAGQSSCVLKSNLMEGVHDLFEDLSNYNIGHITGPTFNRDSHIDGEFDRLAGNIDWLLKRYCSAGK